ncbi:very short patch repair endonuclease [Xenorhabdus bovienii]|uniref:very short patch repair endonuclease n=1 Tax=Xenorhabdus bovienii TaxID=40576 RepID=UPI0023B2D927|nr:DNA mismatch endonuclease Vsr [Xenorhabdus bovienii]MDE9544545.1 DNA mismatch endonuclease Vsr [Xenorhabdus bovienii]MDE9550737.1 DNA mismatch endonuclease Vsr [Xenorhabdus bovienii]
MVKNNNPEIRSRIMRSIRSSNTSIEKKVEKIIEEFGVAYRKQVSELLGKPDFVIDEYQAVLFVHGCFWHGHECYIFKPPMTRREFWLKKINGNIHRDRMVVSYLLNLGWKVLIVWECSLQGKYKLSDNKLSERIEEWLCEDYSFAEIDANGIHDVYLH